MELKEFRKRYPLSEQQHKKIKALLNFADTMKKFADWSPLHLIARYFQQGFLDQEMDDFLDYLLRKHSIDYQKWCYRTPWVKAQIAQKQPKKRKKSVSATQLLFPLEDLENQRLNAWKHMPIPMSFSRRKYYQPTFIR